MKYVLTIETDDAEELADVTVALDNLAIQRARRLADKVVVAEIQAEVLAGSALDRELAAAEADAHRPRAASNDQLMGREPFTPVEAYFEGQPREECQRLAGEEKAAQALARARQLDANAEASRFQGPPGVLKNPFADPTEFKAGIYDAFLDNQLYGLPIFVYKAQAGNYFLAKAYDNGSFTYLGAATRFTRPDLRRADQSQFGLETGICGICARELTDPESIARGIGPVCAGK